MTEQTQAKPKTITWYDIMDKDTQMVCTLSTAITEEIAELLGLGFFTPRDNSSDSFWYMEKPKTKEVQQRLGDWMTARTKLPVEWKPNTPKVSERFEMAFTDPNGYVFGHMENKEAEAYADDLIQKYHPHLLGANIRYYFQAKKADEAKVQASKTSFAQAKKASPLVRHLSGVDFVVYFSEGAWELLSQKDRKALVDHELCFFNMEEGEWALKAPEFSGFYDIAKRHPGFVVAMNKLQSRIEKD